MYVFPTLKLHIYKYDQNPTIIGYEFTDNSIKYVSNTGVNTLLEE